MCCSSKVDVGWVSRFSAYKVNASLSKLYPVGSAVKPVPNQGRDCTARSLPTPRPSPLPTTVSDGTLKFWPFFNVTEAEVEKDFVRGILLVIFHLELAVLSAVRRPN